MATARPCVVRGPAWILLVIAALGALLGVVLVLAGETQGVTALSAPPIFSAMAIQLRSKQGGWWRA